MRARAIERSTTWWAAISYPVSWDRRACKASHRPCPPRFHFLEELTQKPCCVWGGKQQKQRLHRWGYAPIDQEERSAGQAPCRLWRQWCCLLSMCTPTFFPSGAPGLSPGSLGEAAVPGTPALLRAGHGNALITPWAVVLLPNSFTPKITAALPCPAGRRPARFRSTISCFIHFIQIFHV